MKLHLIEREQRLSPPPEEVFPFFADALNLELLTPDWLHFKVLSQEPGEIGPGALIRYRLRLRGIPIRWLTRIEQWRPNSRFTDVQVRGPYRCWHHTHEFVPHQGGTLMRDRVRYAMRAGRLGERLQRSIVAGDLERIFNYRRERVAELFERSPGPG